MLYETYQKGNYQVITLEEALHMSSDISELESVITEFLKKDIVNIAVHLQEDSYFNSRSGAVFVRCWETIKEHNGVLALVNINRSIRDFLAIIDLESEIPIYNSEDELASAEPMD